MSNIGIGIEFSGTENVSRTINNIKSGLSSLETEANSVGRSTTDAFGKAKSGLDELGKAAEKAGNSFTVLKGASSVFLGELAVRIQSAAIKAVKMLAKEVVELGKEMISLGLESNTSAKSMFDNFNNQITKLKTLFGGEMVEVIGPALQDIATKISSIIDSGQLQPLIDSFGSLFSSIWDCGVATGNLLLKITGVNNEKDAIDTIANSFDRMRIIVDLVADALKRVEAIITKLHLDTAFNFMTNAAFPFGSALWGWSGQKVDQEKANQYTDNERRAREQTKATEENTEQTQRATFVVDSYSSSMESASQTVRGFEGALSSAGDALGNIFGGSIGGSSGGKGCRTFGTTLSVTGGIDSQGYGAITGQSGRYDLQSWSNHIVQVPDALITKQGDIVKFHPDDNILAYKDPSALRGKGGNTIYNTFNISGGNPDDIAEKIMKKIEKIQRMS